MKSIVLLLVVAVIAVSSEYLRVPGGLVHSSCIYRLTEQNSLIEHEGDELVVTGGETGEILRISKCPYPVRRNDRTTHGPAWKTWAQYQNTELISSLTGYWTVPPQPTSSDSQILYFWNGVEPTDNSEVLQPVLQWGYTPAGGGDFWGVASWFVSANFGSVVSPLVDSSPNDVIKGYNFRQANGTWTINGTDTNTAQSAVISYTPDESDYSYAYEVLEAYTLSGCDDYPPTGEVTFDQILVEVDGKPVKPTWQTMTKDTTCNEQTVVVSPTEVKITFNTS